VASLNPPLPDLSQVDLTELRAHLRAIAEVQFAEMLQQDEEDEEDDSFSDSSSMPDLEPVNPPRSRPAQDFGEIMREQVEMLMEMMRMNMGSS
jgi:hypothetical protein